MSDLIARVRTMIYDPAGPNQFFTDQIVQDTLDSTREDWRYAPLIIAPSIVNPNQQAASAVTIFADYYASEGWWEADAVIQGQGVNATPWVVLTPVASDWIVGHWVFELNVFQTGTAPGQMPPVFITGKTFDPFSASADLLEMWAAQLAASYDITVDGQTLRRSQLMQAKLNLAAIYRRQARPRRAKLVRHDVRSAIGARRMRLLDEDDVIKGS